MNTVIRKEGP